MKKIAELAFSKGSHKKLDTEISDLEHLGYLPVWHDIMKFLNEVLRKCHSVTLLKIYIRLRSSAYPGGQKWISGIISKIPHRNKKTLFV